MTEAKRTRIPVYVEKSIYLIWFAILVMVVAGSLMPHAGFPGEIVGLDKALHGILYAVLAGLAMGWFHRRRTAILLAVSMAPIGFLMEIAQTRISGREFSAGDLMANNIGVIIGLGLGICWRLKRYYGRRQRANLSSAAPHPEKDPGVS